MNILTIIILILWVFIMLRGYNKGLLKQCFSLASLVIAILVGSWVSPHITSFLAENTGAYENMQDTLSDYLQGELDKDDSQENKQELLNIYGFQLSTDTVDNLIDSGRELFCDTLSESMANMILAAVSFLAAWLVILIVLQCFRKLIDVIGELPIIHSVNKIAGIGVGAVEGLLLLWIFFLVIQLTYTTKIGKNIQSQIQESQILSTLEENNIIEEHLSEI